jgi:hypothetical protein
LKRVGVFDAGVYTEALWLASTIPGSTGAMDEETICGRVVNV